jgi:iron complex outermembrane recepter protein
MKLIKVNLAVLLILFLGLMTANGQTKQILTWRDSLYEIQKLPESQVEEQRDEVARIRTGIEFWLRLHPDTTIKLEAAPPQPWEGEQILQEVNLLRETVDAILKEDRGQAFRLGATEVTVTAEASPLSPVADSIDRNGLLELHATNAVEAATYLPGVTADYEAGRNQTAIMIRGFDKRQVMMYLDGIPIYVPFEGFTDISRSLTDDISHIEVAKGYSSPLLGPNGLGGTVNLVTRQPEKKIEGEALLGTGSGRRIESGAHVGSRLGKVFFRGGMDWLQTDYYPLAGNFTVNSLQPSYQRVDADNRDARYSGRFGWTPRGQDQYVFTYIKQKSENDVPPYSGANTAHNKVKFWDYSYWNRDSYYFNSNTGIGEESSIKFRAFYDKYAYGLNDYADTAHTVMNSFTPYDDYTAGGSSEFTTQLISHNALSGSFFFKDDTHKEHAFNYKNGSLSSVTPWRMDRDRYLSLGFLDGLNLSHGVRATVGLSIDHLRGVVAQDLDSKTNSVIPFACTTGTTTGPCQLADKWDYNPLASISYSVLKTGTAFFSFAQKSHFPTLKDRYSYKSGMALPNPTLEPEHARNYSLGYTQSLAANTMVQIEVFRSDVYNAIENAIVPAQFSNQCKSFASDKCQKAVNIGNEIHKGAEFSVRSSPVRRLNVVANYSFTERNITGPPNMMSVYATGIPKHKAILTASWRMPREVVMLATARYESGAYTVDSAGKVFPASTRFVKVDWGMKIPIGHIASLQGGIKNIFDRNYYYQEGYPEAGRNFYTNVRFRF